MFRDAKGKPLDAKVGTYRFAAIFGLLGEHPEEDGCEPERPLCLTLCGVTGKLHPAPGTAVSDFANMNAACQPIAQPPAGRKRLALQNRRGGGGRSPPVPGVCPGPRAEKTFFFGAGMRPSRCAFLRASLRCLRTASDFSRFARSEGFS